jgi:lipid A oxidase
MRPALGIFLLLVSAVPARADWTLAAYLGSSFTRPATLTLREAGTSTRIPHVHFDARPFASPPYYGYRAGWRGAHAFGVEAELIHLKVFARSADLPRNVGRFSISHGLNLLLGNITWTAAERHRIDLELRAGAGVAIPHGESVISGIAQEQYEVSSLAVQIAAGPVVRLAGRLSAFGEYKLTTTEASVSVAGGHVAGRYTSQHVALGVGCTF